MGRQEAACPQCVNQNVTSVAEAPFCHRKLQDNVCDVPVGTKVPPGTGAPQHIFDGMQKGSSAKQSHCSVQGGLNSQTLSDLTNLAELFSASIQ